MAIEVVHGSPYSIWVPVDTGITVYVGSIVSYAITDDSLLEGVAVRTQADGIANLTNYDYPLGVVIGTNEKTLRYSTTYKTEYTTQAGASDPHDGATREYFGVEGPWSKGDQTAMVKIAVITPSTILKAPIYNAAVGTAPSLLTATAGNASGVQVTTNSCDFTPVRGLATIYCRTGGNAGIYRVTDDTSKTTATWDMAMPSDTASGDTFVRVPLKVGISYVRLGEDTTCGYIDCSEKPATNYDIIHVTRLDLREAGKEFAEFFFDVSSLATWRATT